jgi:L-lactate dehydrogenase complex protein LldF
MKAGAFVLSHPVRLSMAEKVGSLAGRLVGQGGQISRVPGLGSWTNARDAPAPPAESFRAWWKKRVRAKARRARAAERTGRDEQ